MYFGGKFVHARKRLWKCICQDGPQWLSLGDWVSLGSFSFLLLIVPIFFFSPPLPPSLSPPSL